MSIYKDCDIRGIFEKELFSQDARNIGRAIGTMAGGKDLVVAGDVRLSTPVLKEELIKGLVECGAHVIDIGFAPTPVFYFAKGVHGLNTYGGVTVTASHNPPAYNGMKLILGEYPVVPATIQEIARIIEEEAFVYAKGSVEKVDDVFDRYAAFLKTLVSRGNKKVVLDCCDGTTSLNAPALFREMGYDVVELFCGVDGSFPNRDPNPAVYSHLTALRAKVVETGADFGMAFDGDGDRVVFVDERGEIVVSEQALVLLIREYLKDEPASVVFDLKCSSVVAKETEALGGEPRMERSGHAFIKRNFMDHNSALAGEISGHFFFRELGHDDGTYAGLKIGEIVTKSGKTLGQLVDTIPKTLITPDIRLHVPYEVQDGVVERMRALGEKHKLTTIDGVRVDFSEGWLLVRKSVTEQAMTVRIEAQDEQAMEKIKSILIETAPELAF